MITLLDTFNGRVISRHHSIPAAVKAQRRHLARVRRANGANSYLNYAFRENGKPVADCEITAVRLELDRQSH